MSDKPTEKYKSLPARGEETEYYQRINVMLVDLGTDTLLKLFKSLIPNGDFKLFLKSNSEELKKGLFRYQYKRISKEKFVETELDIDILIKLIGLLPKHGPSKNPSLEVELKKLQKIRNELVAHRPVAKISKEDFIRNWDTISLILTRILPDGQQQKELDRRIKDYKTCRLSPSHVKEIFDKLQEQSNLSKQIKELGEQIEEFELFFTHPPENYIPYVILLFDGGRLVLRGVLDREMKKKNISFVELVQENLDKFPSNITDVSCLDISVLAEIILTLFRDSLSQSDYNHIQCIRDARNIYADSAKLSLDTSKFMLKWTALTRSLDSLLMNIDDNSKDIYEKILQKCLDGHFDHNTAVQYLNQLKANGIRTLQEVYADAFSELKTLSQTTEDADLPLQEAKIEMKVVVHCKSPRVKRRVEDDLLADFQTAMKQSNRSDTNQQQNEVDTLLQEIRGGNEGITITDVKKKCILIVIQLSTRTATNYLINFVQSADFGRHIEHVSRMLCLEYGEAISIQAKLTFESIKRLSDHMTQQSKRHLTQENIEDISSKRTKLEQSVTPQNGKIINSESYA